MNLKSATYLVLIALLPLVGNAQVDTTATDSIVIQLPAFQNDTLAASSLDSLLVGAEPANANTDTLESAGPTLSLR